MPSSNAAKLWWKRSSDRLTVASARAATVDRNAYRLELRGRRGVAHGATAYALWFCPISPWAIKRRSNCSPKAPRPWMKSLLPKESPGID